MVLICLLISKFKIVDGKNETAIGQVTEIGYVEIGNIHQVYNYKWWDIWS